jgi:hypothetical protein
MTTAIPVCCPRCLTVIGHGHLAVDGGNVGGWVEQWAHECAGLITKESE